MTTASLRFTSNYSQMMLLLAVAVMVALMEKSEVGASPVVMEAPSSLAAAENALALRMLRAYVEKLREEREQLAEPDDYSNGYVLLEDLKSIKRATGPRPLRFG